MERRLLFAFLLCLSLSAFKTDAVAQQPPAVPTPSPVVPEMGKIRDLGVGYSPRGEFSKYLFIGEDNKYHHWLEVWRVKNTSAPNIVIYAMEPNFIITWGRGPILTGVFNPLCFPSTAPVFGEKDYWFASMKGRKLSFQLVDQEDEQNNLKGIFVNLNAAAMQTRAGGLLDTPNRASLWESNIISRFQKGKRKWINPAWVQPMTVCIKAGS